MIKWHSNILIKINFEKDRAIDSFKRSIKAEHIGIFRLWALMSNIVGY